MFFSAAFMRLPPEPFASHLFRRLKQKVKLPSPCLQSRMMQMFCDSFLVTIWREISK